MEKFDDENNLYVRADKKIRNEKIPYLRKFEDKRKKTLRIYNFLTISIY